MHADTEPISLLQACCTCSHGALNLESTLFVRAVVGWSVHQNVQDVPHDSVSAMGGDVDEVHMHCSGMCYTEKIGCKPSNTQHRTTARRSADLSNPNQMPLIANAIDC